MLLHEFLAGEDRSARAVRCRRALQLGQRLVDHRCVEDLLHRVLGLELRVRVVHRVLVVLPADPREVLGLGAVTIHVIASGVAEHPRRRRSTRELALGDHRRHVLVHRVRAIGEVPGQRSLLHLLEAEREHAFGEPTFDELARHEQSRRAGRAVVVDVVDRDPGKAELIDRALAAGRLAVYVTDARLLDLLVVDLGVGQSVGDRLLGHVRVVPFLGLGLLELGHADSDNENLASHLFLLTLTVTAAFVRTGSPRSLVSARTMMLGHLHATST